MLEKNVTHSESRVGSQLQETLDGWHAEVWCSNVQGGAKVKVTTGGIYRYEKKKKREKKEINKDTLVLYILNS